MKSKLLTLAGILALLGVLGKFYAIPAIAQVVRAALVQDRDNPARQPFTTKVAITDASDTAAFPPVPAGKRMIITGMYYNIAATATGAQCSATVNADNGHESRYNLTAINDFFTPLYAGAFAFDIPLDPGQQGQVHLFCSVSSGGTTVILTPIPNALGYATEMNVVFAGYYIDVP